MQTTYPIVRARAVEGMTVGPRRCVNRTLPWKAQQTQIRFTAGSQTDDVVLTVTDDKTAQVYTITTTGSATEATMLDNLLAGFQANAKLNSLFTVTEDGVDDFVMTARHANRSYTVTCTGGPSATPPAVSTLQASGGSGIEFGRFVARGSADGEIEAVAASTVLSQLEGMMVRTDANHFHSLENDTSAAVDTARRGQVWSVLRAGQVYVKVEEAVTPASTPYLRVAQTSSAGRVGGLRASPAGGQQLWTVTPTAVALTDYMIEVEYLGVKYGAHYTSDASATATEICDNLRTVLGTVAGLTIGGTATLTVQTDAGTQAIVTDRSEPGVLAVVETTGEDVDAIDISSIAKFESSASADGYALLSLLMI